VAGGVAPFWECRFGSSDSVVDVFLAGDLDFVGYELVGAGVVDCESLATTGWAVLSCVH
jgi:hypothetical protein